MVFKYSQFPTSGEKDVFIYRPTIPIVLKYRTNFILVEALVDSGADQTILPVEIATTLNIPLDASSVTSFLGAGGNSFEVYRSQVLVQHILRAPGFRPIQWGTKVYFTQSQPTILLGQDGFLNRFRVTLDGIKKQIEIK